MLLLLVSLSTGSCVFMSLLIVNTYTMVHHNVRTRMTTTLVTKIYYKRERTQSSCEIEDFVETQFICKKKLCVILR